MYISSVWSYFQCTSAAKVASQRLLDGNVTSNRGSRRRDTEVAGGAAEAGRSMAFGGSSSGTLLSESACATHTFVSSPGPQCRWQARGSSRLTVLGG